jgi:hypothetical protein
MPTLRFWINAFIPRDVTGYTIRIPTGIHSGKTGIPLPGIARLWPGNTAKDWNAGYLTDQRSFDNTYGASSRMTSMCEIDLMSGTIVRQAHTSSGTTEVNLVSGVQTGFAYANMSRCSYTVPTALPPLGHFAAGRRPIAYPMAPTPSGPGARFASVSLRLSASAGDPLVGAAADIDYNGSLSISGGAIPGTVAVSFDGLIDDFPAYDCYASLDGVTKTLFTDSPPPGNTVADLLGAPVRPKSGSVSFP